MLLIHYDSFWASTEFWNEVLNKSSEAFGKFGSHVSMRIALLKQTMIFLLIWPCLTAESTPEFARNMSPRTARWMVKIFTFLVWELSHSLLSRIQRFTCIYINLQCINRWLQRFARQKSKKKGRKLIKKQISWRYKLNIFFFVFALILLSEKNQVVRNDVLSTL